MKCNSCGSDVKAEQKFCSNCGNALSNEVKEITENNVIEANASNNVSNGVSKRPEETGNKYVLYAFLCFVMGKITQFSMAFLAYTNNALLSFLGNFVWVFNVASFVLLVYTKIKYPKNKLATIFLILYVLYIVFMIVVFVLLAVMCAKGCSDFFNALDSCD